jgi:predicted ATPase/DNA-binding CsgD family transcriptional regulator
MSDTRPAVPILFTPLIGREKEIATLRDLSQDEHVRLLTLTGPGGVGKTRLALQLAADFAASGEMFRGGIDFVPLAPITDPDLILPTIAQTVRLQPTNRRLLDQLIAHFNGERLLVLDNFEQIIPAAPVIHQLLINCLGLKILVTSRASLHLSGEHEFPVSPLPPASAVELFNRRAQAIQPDFDPAGQNAEVITGICQQLDGLPLAIELAAARIKLLPPRAMLARLGSRLSLLTEGPRDAPLRHQSLRAALDWSYSLLELGEQRLFRRLGLFIGGCTLNAAEAVCNLPGELPLNVMSHAQALIDKSLLQREEDPEGEPRLWMLETVREYALEQLRASDEISAARRAYARYYLSFAQTAEPHLVGADQRIWLNRLAGERHNLRAVLRWAVESGDESAIENGLLTGAALGRFWTYRGHLIEGYDSLTNLLALPGASKPELNRARALALNTAGLLAIRRSAYEEAASLFEMSLVLWRGLGDEGWRGQALALDSLGWVASAYGQFERARQLYEESLKLHREKGVSQNTEAADVLAHWGMAEFFDGEYVRAQPLLEESLEIKRALGERWGMGFALFHLGCAAISRRQYEEAKTHILQGLDVCADLNERLLRAFLLEALAWLAFVSPEKADPLSSARIFGAVEALRQQIGAPRPPQWRALVEKVQSDVKTALGADSFLKELEVGKRLPAEDALAIFLQPVEKRIDSSILSPRELEVLQLVAAGLTDAQVAQKLVVSTRTVHSHLQSIYNKLGVNSRTAALRIAAEQKIIE